MTSKMKSLVTGLIMGLFGHGVYDAENDVSYAFDPDTGLLIINRDDGSLNYKVNESLQLEVSEVQETTEPIESE